MTVLVILAVFVAVQLVAIGAELVPLDRRYPPYPPRLRPVRVSTARYLWASATAPEPAP